MSVLLKPEFPTPDRPSNIRVLFDHYRRGILELAYDWEFCPACKSYLYPSHIDSPCFNQWVDNKAYERAQRELRAANPKSNPNKPTL